MKKIIDKIELWSTWLAMLFLALMVIVTVVTIFTRYFLSYYPSWTIEIQKLLMVLFSSLGLAIGIRQNIHISIEYFYNKFNKRYKFIISLVEYIFILFVGIVLFWYGLKLYRDLWNVSMNGINLPTGLNYLGLWIAGILIIIFILEKLFILLLDNMKKVNNNLVKKKEGF